MKKFKIKKNVFQKSLLINTITKTGKKVVLIKKIKISLPYG